MKRITVKQLSAAVTVLALIAGAFLISSGSTAADVFSLPGKTLMQARTTYAIGLFEGILGVGALVVAFLGFRTYLRQY